MRSAVRWCWIMVVSWMPLVCDAAESSSPAHSAAAPADDALIKASRDAKQEPEKIKALLDKPLYKFTEAEVDSYLKFLQSSEPDLRRRIVHLARKNIGQPYELDLLGEMPFESYDPQPLYCLGKSECVAFGEHAYAMALSRDWAAFMAMLQRIRYRDGRIGVATRNHFTEADWNVSNRWLVRDITAELAGKSVKKFKQTIDRASFLQKRYKLNVDIPVEQHQDVYLPLSAITLVEAQLQDGDLVNVVSGVTKKGGDENSKMFGGNVFVEHVGIIVNGTDGTVHMIYSSPPAVREEPLVDFISRQNEGRKRQKKAGKPVLLGFKFLRLEADPLANLREIDGKEAPRVTLPNGGKAEF